MQILQRIEVGEEVFYAAAVLMMKDPDATFDALSRGVTVQVLIELINFTAAGSTRKASKRIARLRKKGFELLAVILPDGACKYWLGNPQHLALAEKLALQVDKEALRHMRIDGPVQ